MRRVSSVLPIALARLVGPALASLLVACLVNENVDLGHDVDAGSLPGAEALDAASPGDDGAPLTSVAIDAPTGTICRGDCVALVAVASGGDGVYAYSWGQGLGPGPGPKMVCPAATATYSVTAGSSTSEAQSTASATLVVVPCDAGAAPPGSSDAGPEPADADANLCVLDPSFEGPTMIGTSGPPAPRRRRRRLNGKFASGRPTSIRR